MRDSLKGESEIMTEPKQHESKIFDTSTLQGLQAAERYQARLYNQYDSVTVRAIGLDRCEVIGRKPTFVQHNPDNHGQAGDIVSVVNQRNL